MIGERARSSSPIPFLRTRLQAVRATATAAADAARDARHQADAAWRKAAMHQADADRIEVQLAEMEAARRLDHG